MGNCASGSPQRVYVAIDFGTSRSGFAYIIGKESSDVNLVTEWPGAPDGIDAPKTLTSLLYKRCGNGPWIACAWGWTALREYMALKPNQARDYAYCTQFKLHLAEDGNQGNLPDGITAQRAIADYLRYLAEYLDSKLKEHHQGYERRHIKCWCLTVPACWSESAKQTMRDACIEAGIVDAASMQTRLKLLHEPEAACLAVIKDKVCNVEVKPGQKVMVIDAGGGTVDFTVHSLDVAAGKEVVKECTHRVAVMHGSTFVDKRFEEFVASKIDAYNKWKQERPVDHMKWMANNWEPLKCSHKSADHPDAIQRYEVWFPESLVSLMSVQLRRQLEEEQEGNYDRIYITRLQMDRQIFNVPVTEVVKSAYQVYEKAGEGARIFLVGGFGCSNYLYSRIKARFMNKKMVPVDNPVSAQSAILQGAVFHARDHTVISSRCSPMMYGIRCCRPLCPGEVAADSFIDKVTGMPHTAMGFLKFVDLNQELSVDSEIEHTFTPGTTTTDSAEFEVYGTDKPESDNPPFITGMRRIACVTVSDLQQHGLAKIQDHTQYKLTASMKFGDAYFTVTVVDTVSGRQFASQISYD